MREKPDWAERLQRTFKRKYTLGYDEGHKIGYDAGFLDGSKKAVHESRKVFIKRIQKELAEVTPTANIEFLNGLNKAIDLIRKAK
jgi:flagellar biosynthesis/type III secretory pathway protein FliH